MSAFRFSPLKGKDMTDNKKPRLSLRFQPSTRQKPPDRDLEKVEVDRGLWKLVPRVTRMQ